MKAIERLAASIDDMLELILGRDLQRGVDVYIRQYPHLHTY